MQHCFSRFEIRPPLTSDAQRVSSLRETVVVMLSKDEGSSNCRAGFPAYHPSFAVAFINTD